MSISRRYRIKYDKYHGDVSTINNQFKLAIEKIYNNVNQKFENENRYVILTGSGALFIYLLALGHQDLLSSDDFNEPNDVDLLLVHNSTKSTPEIFLSEIGNYKIINKDTKQVISATPQKSITLLDSTSMDKLKEFDLTSIVGSGKHNMIGNLKVITLDELRGYYADDDRPETEKEKKEADMKKIKIIDEIIRRGVNPPTVNAGQPFKSQELSTNRSSLLSVSRNLFDDTPSPFGNMGGGSYYKLANLAKLSNMKIN